MKAPIHNLIWLFTLHMLWLPCKGQEMKWGQISSSDLEMKTYAHDPEAGAVILGDVGKVEFELRSDENTIRKERHTRIKFLSQAGIGDYGDIQIWYYSYDNKEVVTDLIAQVYLPDGSHVRVKDEHIFRTKESNWWTSLTIAVPSLVPGAIVEYQYRLISKDIFQPVDWFFQREIPVAYSDLTVTVPHYYSYVILEQGRGINERDYDQHKSLSPYGNTEVTFYKTQYISRNVEALKHEKFITTMNDYRSRIRYQLKVVDSPYRPRREVLESWESVESRLLDRELFGKAVNAPANGSKVLAFAGMHNAGTESQLDQARKLFRYLCNHLNWNGGYSYSFNETVDHVLTKKEGTSSELNLVLLAGLKALGIPAAPVLTSTRSHGQLIELYPILDQFNHTLVNAKIDNKEYFLDVVPGQSFGLPRAEALNYRGWRLEKGNSAWVDIMPEMSQSTYFMKMVCSADGRMEGSIQGKFTGYHGLRERSDFHRNPETYFNGELLAGSYGVQVRQFQFQNQDNPDLPWGFNASLVAEPGVETADYIYLSVPCIELLNSNPFTAAERHFPIEFHYPHAYKFVADIQMPEGFVVESLPSEKTLKTEDGGITFVYRCSELQGRIQVKFDFGISNLRYAPELYGMLKRMFDEISAVTAEQIVLKKA